MTPLAIDLYCGLGGWSEGLLAEGYDVIGFDIERHKYPAYEQLEGGGTKVGGITFNGYGQPGYKPVAFNGTAEKRLHEYRGEQIGWQEYPGQLVLQDVLTLHGRQFKDAALIVASPPCQEYSYMAMPWSRAKAIAAEYRSGVRDVKKLTALFDACFRIQREASEAAGRHIPMVVENVRGAIPWVGRSRWNFGSFHLWGDVPALMPMTARLPFKGGDRNIGRVNGEHKWNTEFKNPGMRFDGSGRSFQSESVDRHISKAWRDHHYDKTDKMRLREDTGTKQGGDWFNAEQPSISRMCGSKSPGRKAASAMIAKIPLPLSRHIARTFRPGELCI